MQSVRMSLIIKSVFNNLCFHSEKPTFMSIKKTTVQKKIVKLWSCWNRICGFARPRLFTYTMQTCRWRLMEWSCPAVALPPMRCRAGVNYFVFERLYLNLRALLKDGECMHNLWCVHNWITRTDTKTFRLHEYVCSLRKAAVWTCCVWCSPRLVMGGMLGLQSRSSRENKERERER